MNDTLLTDGHDTQKLVMTQIWDDRLHFSQVSELPVSFAPTTFAHIVPKGKYQRWKTIPMNIILLTPEEHHDYDFLTHKVINDSKWVWVFEVASLIKRVDTLINRINPSLTLKDCAPFDGQIKELINEAVAILVKHTKKRKKW